MVNYTYQNLFYKSHQTKDILIVDNEATVTPVTGQPPSVTGATVEIHTGDLASESFELDESLCSEDNIKFGLCESACVRFTIDNKDSIPNLKSTSYSKVLNIYIYFNGNSDTLFQIGTYICEKDEYSINRKQREVELYDALHYLYDFDVTTFYNNVFKTSPVATIKGIRDGLFTYLATEFDYPIEQTTVTLVNDNTLVNKNIKSDTITFGFLMEQMLEVCGVFGHINREGKFDYISLAKYDEESVAQVTDSFRKPPTQYKDYIVWYVEKVRVYDRNNLKRCTVGSSSHKVPNIYKVIDNFVCESYSTSDTDVALLKLVAENMHSNIIYVRYKPCEIDCVGNPCIEVGDKIDVEYDKDGDGVTETFYTIVLERHLRGLGTMLDNYIARGDKKQPKYKPNQNWHETDGAETETTSGEGVDGVVEVKDETLNQFVQIIRNIGFRLLPEPSDVSVEYTNGQVEIKWSDPDDITNYKPVPCEWAGTVLVRKEGSSPLHRFGGDFGGTVLVDNTVRDTYKTNAYVDNTVEPNKKYYYGIFPYHVALDDADHPIKHYRFTKVFSVNTEENITAPSIIYAVCDEGTDVVITYLLPVLTDSTYSYVKLAYKKDGIPKSLTDADGLIDITNNPIEPMLHSGQYTVTGLDELTEYYFVIFVENSKGTQADSEPASCITKEDLGTDFSYTGEIQTFTAPKTGIYSLETWGAQGGDATDGTNTARGGYGAYAYGEVLLQQGDVLYVNVGGQNGYGGGGNYTPPNN
jgi:hypothetical protein